MASSVTRLRGPGEPMKRVQELKVRETSQGNKFAGGSESYHTSYNGSWSLPTTFMSKISWADFNTSGSKPLRSATQSSLIGANLFDTLQGPALKSETLVTANEWYSRFLTRKILEAWPLVAEVVLDVPQTAPDLEFGDYGLQNALTIVLCQVLRTMDRRDLALVEITDELYNCGLLKQTNLERTEALQLAFAMVGWLSMLYEPETDPGDFLQISIPNSEIFDDQRSRTSRYKNKVIKSRRQNLDCVDLPLDGLLRRFGNLIPQRWWYSDAFNMKRQNLPHYSAPGREDWIDVSFVCFHTLHKLSNVKIEWVDSLSLHLVFDSRTRVLSVFKFPSFAFLMYHSESGRILGRLLCSSRTHSELRGQESLTEAQHFFREVLISYRLIFGQTRSSRNDFNRTYSKLNFWSKQPNPDPLITILCGQNWESESAMQIYYDIEADDPSNHYDARYDFPFLGRRLLELQDYIRGQNPEAMGALWHDRRNVSYWWTLWAIIVIGGFLLLFALAQSVLQIFKLLYFGQDQTGDHDSPIGDPSITPPENGEENLERFKITFASLLALVLGILAATILLIAFWPRLKRLFWACRKERLPIGRCRVHWKCHCGQKLHDDFLEGKPGAAEKFARSMEAEQSIPPIDASNTRSVDIESQSTSTLSQYPSSTTLSRMSSWVSSRIRSPKESACELTEIPKDHGKDGDSSEPNEPLYLLLCVENNDGSIRLLQINVAGIMSDRALFSHIRGQYLKIRGKWLPRFSLRCLQAINFVQFELWPSGDVEVKQYQDYKMLPYGKKMDDYSYHNTPETYPPVGTGKLMHLWKTPGHLDGNGQTCLGRFAKKKRERLHVGPSGDPADGWGIHLVEGPDWAIISVLIVSIALLGSLVFGVSFAVLYHDIQSSFAIASYVVSFAALSIGGCSICSRRIKSTPGSVEG